MTDLHTYDVCFFDEESAEQASAWLSLQGRQVTACLTGIPSAGRAQAHADHSAYHQVVLKASFHKFQHLRPVSTLHSLLGSVRSAQTARSLSVRGPSAHEHSFRKIRCKFVQWFTVRECACSARQSILTSMLQGRLGTPSDGAIMLHGCERQGDMPP